MPSFPSLPPADDDQIEKTLDVLRPEDVVRESEAEEYDNTPDQAGDDDHDPRHDVATQQLLGLSPTPATSVDTKPAAAPQAAPVRRGRARRGSWWHPERGYVMPNTPGASPVVAQPGGKKVGKDALASPKSEPEPVSAQPEPKEAIETPAVQAPPKANGASCGWPAGMPRNPIKRAAWEAARAAAAASGTPPPQIITERQRRDIARNAATDPFARVATLRSEQGRLQQRLEEIDQELSAALQEAEEAIQTMRGGAR